MVQKMVEERDYNRELTSFLFMKRESGICHFEHEEEVAFYDMVKMGDVEALKKREKAGGFDHLNDPERGQLSKDSLRNHRYHLVINIAMLARVCIDGGLPTEESYAISDMYIQKADEAREHRELRDIHVASIFAFAREMEKKQRKRNHSLHIVRCLDYIYLHLHDDLNIEAIASYLGLNSNYVSKLFKKEMGVTVSQYICDKRVEAATNMLKYSEYSLADIANYLNFHSQSYFIKVFKEKTGRTPGEYRKENYNHYWENKQ